MKTAPAPTFLSAREAAAELSVSLATLYAYVSRGLVRSEPVGDGRARRYRADDIRALRARRRSSGAIQPSAEAAIPVLDTRVATITEAGPIYRGVPVVALAEAATVEQAATLLWDARRSDPFDAANMPVLGNAMQAILAASADAKPLPRAIAVLALASDADPRAHNRSAEGRAATGARVMRLVTAAILRTAPSPLPIHRQVASAWGKDHPAAEDLLRRALVLLADHELNASTWTARCAASTGVSLYDAVIAGLAALKGPRHGGAGPLAARMVAEFGDGDVAAQIADRVALGEPIPGFGHTVYVDGDPRADVLLRALAAAGADARLVADVPRLVTEATGLYPNIDYALAVLIRTLGLPVGHEMALFAIARTSGWIAHAIEQLQSGILIRPRARYVGPEAGRSGAD
ncbi:MAG: citrate synthase family protein [Mesorhizobium sp.]|nr:citrate synthase family protein [Mesorhizobium sp.]MCO5162971.1 citrate synthase family protein [Mesorhizobium sp.]